MTKKREFDHDSLQDLGSIVQYLTTLTDGFRSGNLVMSGRDGEIVLKPHGLVRMELRVSQRDDRNRLNLRFTWKPVREDEEANRSRLQIRVEAD